MVGTWDLVAGQLVGGIEVGIVFAVDVPPLALERTFLRSVVFGHGKSLRFRLWRWHRLRGRGAGVVRVVRPGVVIGC